MRVLSNAGLFALLYFFSISLSSQSYIDTQIKTGYITESKIVDIIPFQDTLIAVGWQKRYSDNSFQKMVTIYSMRNLARKQTLTIGQNTKTDYGGLFLSNMNQGYIITAKDYADSLSLALFQINQQTTQIIKLFSKVVNKAYSLKNIKIIDNELYAMIFNGNFSTDTTEILVYDLSGNLLRSKKDFIKSDYSNWDSTFHGTFKLGPYQHPINPNSIVYGSWLECRIVEIDKRSLNIRYAMPRGPIDIFYSDPFLYGYELYPDKIVCGGSIQYFKQRKLDFVGQSYFQSRAWNGDTLEKRRFGNLNVEEKAYAFYSDPSTATHFVGGAAPFNNFLPYGAEYRKMIIHRFNQFGEDSIVLYGNKNHVAYQIQKGSNDDLFIVSGYNDAWTTDSSYIQLTKIPGFAISLIEQKKVSSNIQLYPNPTHDYLIVEDLMGTPTSIEVYDQQGKLHLRTEIKDDPKVSLQGIKNGMYVVVVTSKDGSKYSAIVKKE